MIPTSTGHLKQNMTPPIPTQSTFDSYLNAVLEEEKPSFKEKLKSFGWGIFKKLNLLKDE